MLVLDTLKQGIEKDWLVAEGGSYPQDAMESGRRFAGAVVTWFSAAQAGPSPCSTAEARKGELESAAAAALQAGTAQGAGAALSLAVAQYMSGQVFGTGVAQMPLATAAATSQMVTTFTNQDLSITDRAQAIAEACALLASSTQVIFSPPPPLSPAPVT